MDEPLDLTSIGAKEAAPRERKARRSPRRLPVGMASPKAKARAALVVLATVALATAGFLILGRGRTERVARAGEQVARYCQAAIEFDRIIPSVASGSATLDTSAGAVTLVMQQLGGTVEQMRADAPAAIRTDVSAALTALERAAKGDPTGMRSASFPTQLRRITDFRQRTCMAGLGSTEH